MYYHICLILFAISLTGVMLFACYKNYTRIPLPTTVTNILDYYSTDETSDDSLI